MIKHSAPCCAHYIWLQGKGVFDFDLEEGLLCLLGLSPPPMEVTAGAGTGKLPDWRMLLILFKAVFGRLSQLIEGSAQPGHGVALI